MKTFIAGLIALVMLNGCGSSSSNDPSESTLPEATRLIMSGSGDLGIFDPSIEHDPDSGRLWMSYSSVDSSAYYDSSVYWAVSIRLAYSDDNGASWIDQSTVVADYDQRLLGPINELSPLGNIPANSQGIWQSETSSLIHDPSAPVAERWKLIWFQYLNANLISYFADYSWIAMKTAATPIDLATATPTKLFSGAGLHPDNIITGTPVHAPTAGLPAIRLNLDLSKARGNADLTDLNLCVFAEPGLHASNDALYLAIFCANAETDPITESLEYFRCSSPCNIGHSVNWEYLGRLLTKADALTATGDDHFQAPSLIENDGKTYLIVNTVNTSSGNRYNGCRVYEFVDVNSNQLRRNNGVLVEVARVKGKADEHHGACSGYSGINGGILLSQYESDRPSKNFTIYQSQVTLP